MIIGFLLRLLTKDAGSCASLRHTVSAGEIAGFVAIKRDVTGRRAKEEAQRLLAGIVENSDDAVFTCSPGHSHLEPA